MDLETNPLLVALPWLQFGFIRSVLVGPLSPPTPDCLLCSVELRQCFLLTSGEYATVSISCSVPGHSILLPPGNQPKLPQPT